MAKKTQITNSELKMVDINILKDHPMNPNKHPEAQLNALMESMDKYGQYYPIICDEDYNILAGHGKRMALAKRGDTKVEVRILSGLTDQQKKKLLLEDNKIQEMSFAAYDGVEALIREIGDDDIIGFNKDYIEMLLSESMENPEVMDNTGTVLTSDPKQRKVEGGRGEFRGSEERSEKQAESLESFEENIGVSHGIECPNCGHTINY